MKQLRYTGGFVSRAGAVWRVDILQEAEEAFGSVGELSFPAEEPLVIEWKREDKETVIQGSTAALKVISPGDRTYEGMYAIEAGLIRMDVHKDGSLYWSGTLDPEFYEEPYEAAEGYEVCFTFSDFGILGRIKYGLEGMKTLREIMDHALGSAGLGHCGLDTGLVTTTFTDGAPITGGGLSIDSGNFTDEEGETCTLEEAVEGILQPLAIRMVQRAGKICLYDLNGLYTEGQGAEIRWDGGSQTMGADKVANNARITFSPYSSASLPLGDVEYLGNYGPEYLLPGDFNQGLPAGVYTYYPDMRTYKTEAGAGLDYALVDFGLFVSDKGRGLQSIGAGCKYFHILPVTGGGGECSGVAYAFRAQKDLLLPTGDPGGWVLHEDGVPRAGLNYNAPVLTSKRAFLPKMQGGARYRVRVKEEVLIDARYNPFSGSDESNREDEDETLKKNSAFVFIPARITLYGEDGRVLYHYKNKDIAAGSAYGHIGGSYLFGDGGVTYESGAGRWEEGPDPGGDCWLEYYNPDDLDADAGLRGWKANRHCIGRPDGANGRKETVIYESFKEMGDGEYLPYPPEAGYLEVQIQAGLFGYDYDKETDRDCEFGGEGSDWDTDGIYGKLCWCLYKAPAADVVNYNLTFDEAELEDVEYSGYINRAAKEEISIDTICGTAKKACPTAKGAYRRTDTGEQVATLSRAGVDDHPEKLLIGTLYSQYAGRRTTLSGEAAIDGGLHYYTERNQEGKRFMLMSDVQDAITDCTKAEYCEFGPDEYEAMEEAEEA